MILFSKNYDAVYELENFIEFYEILHPRDCYYPEDMPEEDKTYDLDMRINGYRWGVSGKTRDELFDEAIRLLNWMKNDGKNE